MKTHLQFYPENTCTVLTKLLLKEHVEDPDQHFRRFRWVSPGLQKSLYWNRIPQK